MFMFFFLIRFTALQRLLGLQHCLYTPNVTLMKLWDTVDTGFYSVKIQYKDTLS